jgi:hypothetical protein
MLSPPPSIFFFRHMIDRIYRITGAEDSSWKAERPASHPNHNSVNSVNTVSKQKSAFAPIW